MNKPMEEKEAPEKLLKSLMEEFDQRINILSLVLDIRGDMGSEGVQSKLGGVSDTLNIIEDKIGELRNFISGEMKAVDIANKVIEAASIQSEKLKHAQNNLPSHLPGSARKPEAPKPVKERKRSAETTTTTAAKPVKKKAKPTVSVPDIQFLTKSELESVPSYMRGRTSLKVVNVAIVAIRDIMQEKYSLMAKPWSRLTDTEMTMYQTYRDQECSETEGKHFLTDGDLKTSGQITNTNLKPVIQILRHCNRLKQTKDGGLVRYIIY